MASLRCWLFLLITTSLSQSVGLAAQSDANSPPKPINSLEVKFPESMENSLSRGFCAVVATVDVAGVPSNIRVLRATHPDFVGPSLKAFQAWRFKPALRKGIAVESEWQETIWFDVREGPRTIADYSFGFTPLNGSKVPAEYRFDRAPDVLTVVNPVYPFELAMAGVEGKAEIRLVVPSDGMPEGVTVVSASNPAFGEALKAMAEACLINPAYRRGMVVSSQMKRSQTFSAGANNLTYNRETRKLLELLRSHPDEIVSWGELETKPRPLFRPPPSYPRAYDDSRISGTAEVEFFIDTNGQAQLPHVLSASTPDFGWSAITAVQQWLFEPPQKNGRAVFVRAQIPIEFPPVIRLSRLRREK